MLKRRLVFAAPFVIVACASERKVERRSNPPQPESEPVAVEPEPDPEPDLSTRPPHELVDELPPLSSDRTDADRCRRPGVRCNPPPPGSKKSKPNPVVPILRRVNAMKREPDNTTRVRTDHGARIDERWRAAFVTNSDNPTELTNGECKIVAWSIDEVECVVALPPEGIAYNGHARPVRFVPPRALVERVDREIADWIGGVHTRARVVKVAVTGSETEVTFGYGSEHGLGKDWSVTVHGAPCTIVAVHQQHAVCLVKLTPDQVSQDPNVTITSPGS